MNVNSSGGVLTQCTDAIPAGNVQDFNYGFNLGTSDNGNLASMVATGTASTQSFSRVYGYDALNRLGTMSAPADGCSGLSWTYDAWGNRTDQTQTGGTCFTFHAAADTNNRLVGYSYDAAGNMTNDTNHTYTYDAMNWLTQVKTGATVVASYTYLGALRVKRDFGGTTIYVYSGTVPIAEYAAGAQLTQPLKEYIYSGSQLLATVDASLGTSYQMPDHLSTRVEADANGAVTRTFGHFPFGETWYETGTASKWKFTSYERDSESQLDYAQYRFDSSRLGRFMSPDPVAGSLANPERLNRYSYVLNDSVNLVDTTGQDDTVNPMNLNSPFWNWFSDASHGGGFDALMGAMSWQYQAAAQLGYHFYDLPGMSNEAAQGELRYESIYFGFNHCDPGLGICYGPDPGSYTTGGGPGAGCILGLCLNGAPNLPKTSQQQCMRSLNQWYFAAEAQATAGNQPPSFPDLMLGDLDSLYAVIGTTLIIGPEAGIPLWISGVNKRTWLSLGGMALRRAASFYSINRDYSQGLDFCQSLPVDPED